MGHTGITTLGRRASLGHTGDFTAWPGRWSGACRAWGCGRFVEFPAAAQGFVEADEFAHAGGLAGGESVVEFIQPPLRIQHVEQVAHAVLILQTHQLNGSELVLTPLRPTAALQLAFGVADQRGFDILDGQEHALAVAADHLIALGLGEGDIRLDPAGVEDGPADGRAQ